MSEPGEGGGEGARAAGGCGGGAAPGVSNAASKISEDVGGGAAKEDGGGVISAAPAKAPAPPGDSPGGVGESGAASAGMEGEGPTMPRDRKVAREAWRQEADGGT